MSNRRYIRLAFGLAILAVLIVSVDGKALLTQFVALRVEYLLATASCIIVATLLGSFNAYLIVAIDSHVRYSRFLGYYWVSWALGLVVPGQVGDVAGITYLLKRAGLDWTKIVARALLDKLISFAAMVALASYALLQFFPVLDVKLPTLLSIGALAGIIAIATFFFMRVYVSNSHRGAALAQRILTSFKDVTSFARNHPMLLGINLVGTTVKILLIGSAYWFVFLAGGAIGANWLDIVLLVTVSSLVAYIPISFNGLGTVEVTGILLFGLLGLGDELVLSSYLVLRATVILIAWLPSLPLVLALRKERR